MVTVIGEDVQTTPVEAIDNTYAFDVFDNYSFLALQYTGTTSASIHFDRITREVLEIDPTPINEHERSVAGVVSTRLYNISGQPIDRLMKGVNIVRETFGDGTSRTRKVVVR